jgi:hypothetical protein
MSNSSRSGLGPYDGRGWIATSPCTAAELSLRRAYWIISPRSAAGILSARQTGSRAAQGKLDDGENHVDAGSVIPGVLNVPDLPALAGLRTERPLLVCGARNLQNGGSVEYRRQWQNNLRGKTRSWFRPDQPLTAGLLLSWLRQTR